MGASVQASERERRAGRGLPSATEDAGLIRLGAAKTQIEIAVQKPPRAHQVLLEPSLLASDAGMSQVEPKPLWRRRSIHRGRLLVRLSCFAYVGVHPRAGMPAESPSSHSSACCNRKPSQVVRASSNDQDVAAGGLNALHASGSGFANQPRVETA